MPGLDKTLFFETWDRGRKTSICVVTLTNEAEFELYRTRRFPFRHRLFIGMREANWDDLEQLKEFRTVLVERTHVCAIM